MDLIKTATGKEFPCDYISQIPYPDQIFVRVKGDIGTVASVFANKRETVKLFLGDLYCANYTALVFIQPEGEYIKVCLGKE